MAEFPIEIVDGPRSIFGYDNKIHLDRATHAEWRSFWLKKARQKGTHTQKEWTQLKEKIGKCVSCGSAKSLTKDHIIPISRGGCDCIHNLQPLCSRCNASKGNR